MQTGPVRPVRIYVFVFQTFELDRLPNGVVCVVVSKT
jgi:hypothetical protein